VAASKSARSKWEELRQLAKTDLYFLCKGVLGFADMTPRFHGERCWQMRNVQLPYARQLDLWPRGHLKTHIITIGKSIQDYLNNRNVRILLAGASLDNAKKNLRKIKMIFESNTLLHWLFPECIPNTTSDKWAETEICLPRSANPPESTFKAVGVGGQTTGWHFDILRKDDLIDEKTERSPENMEKIIEWHLLTKNLLESPTKGVDHLIGTRWSSGDLYQYIIDHEKEYTVNCIPAIGPDGQPVWPERFSLEGLMQLREKDPYMFATQQMNNPRDQAVVDFDAQWLRYYYFNDEAMNILAEVG
jgi:hypothetical protein